MRNRKFLIGAALTVTALFATAGVAQAAITQTPLTVSSHFTKQDKKTAGGTDLFFDIPTQFPPGTPASQSPSHTDVDLAKDFSFVPPTATCNPTALTGTTTAQAQSTCGTSIVGQGQATLCNPTVGCSAGPGAIPAVVTAFNGTPSGGNPTLVLHTKPGGIAAPTPPTILTGVLVPSPAGALYGKRLSVTVPDTSSTGLDLADFQTQINKLVTRKANKKKHKPAKYYINSKCSKKSWAFQTSTTFRAGGGTAISTATVPCKQKKSKKKK